MTEFTKEIEDYFCRFTFGQFITIIFVEIVTLFFVFYLGAHYGSDLLGTRRNDLAKEELTLPQNAAKNVDEIVGSGSVDYTYPEVLTQEGTRAIRVKPSGVTAAEYDKKANAPVSPPKEKPLPPIQEEPVVPLPSGKFSIQIGSYPSAEEAQKALEVWKRKGYSAFMTVGEIPNKGTWYRVRLGSFPSREKANEYLSKFKTKEKKIQGIVVSSEG